MKLTDKIEVLNEDCMTVMSRYPDKYFDLAVVDPEYGIKADANAYKNGVMCKANGFKEHLNKSWDNQIPKEEYFSELFRVSRNQIIWGGNYFTQFLPKSSCWLIWNKVQRGYSFADGEMAWTSFDTAVRIFDYARGNESGFAPKLKGADKYGSNIHPTQKPKALYDWIFKNYAYCKTCKGEFGYYEDVVGDGGSRMWFECEECDCKPFKILDTHGGSMSSVISADKAGLEMVCCELDKEYFDKAVDRFNKYKSQLTMELK